MSKSLYLFNKDIATFCPIPGIPLMLSDESPANPFKSGTFFGDILQILFSIYVSMLTNLSDENLFGLEYHIEVLASIN